MKIRYLLLGALLALGCSDLNAPGRLAGTWREESRIPGSGMDFTLAATGDSLAGTGYWTGEACCSGTVTVAGTARDGEVHLSFAFVSTGGHLFPPSTSSFAGRLVGPDMLSGSFDGASQPTVFRRQP